MKTNTKQKPTHLVAYPELSVEVAEAVLVLEPPPVKAERAVPPSLYERPPRPVNHLTVYVIQLGRRVGLHLVHARRAVPPPVDVVTVWGVGDKGCRSIDNNAVPL